MCGDILISLRISNRHQTVFSFAFSRPVVEVALMLFCSSVISNLVPFSTDVKMYSPGLGREKGDIEQRSTV